MTPNRFGQLVTAPAIERAVAEHLTTPDPETNGTWLGTGLGQVERDEGMTPGQLVRPPVISSPEFAKWPEDELPVILAIVPGLTGRPVMRADGKYEARWGLGLAAIVGDVNDEDTQTLAKLYAAGLRWAVLAKPSLGGISGGTTWIDEKYDEVGRNRSLGAGRAVFEVIIPVAVQMGERPAAPLPDDAGDPGLWPAVAEVDHTTQLVPIGEPVA